MNQKKWHSEIPSGDEGSVYCLVFYNICKNSRGRQLNREVWKTGLERIFITYVHLALERGEAKVLKHSSLLGFSYNIIEQQQLDVWGLYSVKITEGNFICYKSAIISLKCSRIFFSLNATLNVLMCSISTSIITSIKLKRSFSGVP